MDKPLEAYQEELKDAVRAMCDLTPGTPDTISKIVRDTVQQRVYALEGKLQREKEAGND